MIGSSATKELNSYLNIKLLPMKANISPDWIFPYIHTHARMHTNTHTLLGKNAIAKKRLRITLEKLKSGVK